MGIFDRAKETADESTARPAGGTGRQEEESRPVDTEPDTSSPTDQGADQQSGSLEQSSNSGTATT